MVLAALTTAAPHVAAQATLEGTWLLDAQRSENAQEMHAARFGGAAAPRAGYGPPAGGAVMRSGGGAAGRMIVRGGGVFVGSLVRGGERVHIELGTASVTLRFDDASPFTLPLTGEAIEVRRGEHTLLSRASLVEGALTIESTGPNEVAVEETFAVTERGEIAAELNITFPQMGGPTTIAVKRIYMRAAEGTR
jgi:hypothetical protein